MLTYRKMTLAECDKISAMDAAPERHDGYYESDPRDLQMVFYVNS